MANFKTLNGYYVKDEQARNNITNLENTKTNIENSVTKYYYGDRTHKIELRTSGSTGSESVSFVVSTPKGNIYDNIYNSKGERQFFLKNEMYMHVYAQTHT